MNIGTAIFVIFCIFLIFRFPKIAGRIALVCLFLFVGAGIYVYVGDQSVKKKNAAYNAAYQQKIKNVKIKIFPCNKYLRKKDGDQSLIWADLFSENEIKEKEKEGYFLLTRLKNSLFVCVKNNTHSPINKISFRISVKRSGYSNDLNSKKYRYDDDFISYKIIEPNNENTLLDSFEETITPQWCVDNKEKLTYSPEDVKIEFGEEIASKKTS